MCCRVIRYLFLLFSIVTRGSRRDGKAVYGCQVSDDEENYLRYHFHRRGVLQTSVLWSDVIRPTLQLERLSLIENYSRLLRLNQAAAIINHMHFNASQNPMFLPSSEHFEHLEIQIRLYAKRTKKIDCPETTPKNNSGCAIQEQGFFSTKNGI